MLLLGSDVRRELGVRWPLVPSVDDGSQKRTVKPWKALQGIADARPYDGLRAELWSVPTGAGIGAVVLDFDGAAGEARRSAWKLDPHVRTGSGGSHVYVSWPGWPVRTCAGVVPGVDVRGDGGVAHVAGRSRKGPYVVLRALSEPVDWRSLCPEARACLVRRRKPAAQSWAEGWRPGAVYAAALVAREVARLGDVGLGGRNQALNKAAYTLGRHHVPLDELGALVEAGVAVGLGLGEAEGTVRSGWAGGFG